MMGARVKVLLAFLRAPCPARDDAGFMSASRADKNLLSPLAQLRHQLRQYKLFRHYYNFTADNQRIYQL